MQNDREMKHPALPGALKAADDSESSDAPRGRKGLPLQPARGVPFGKFAKQAKKRGYSARDIADFIDNGDTFAQRLALAKRILDPKYAKVEIANLTLTELYIGWTRPSNIESDHRCVAGCGRPIRGRSTKRYCSDACRKRHARTTEATVKKRVDEDGE